MATSPLSCRVQSRKSCWLRSSQNVFPFTTHREDEVDGDNKDKIVHAHITSISVLRTYRRLGIATKLMLASEQTMREVHDADYLSLHVRVTNRAAIGLYKDVLGFK